MVVLDTNVVSEIIRVRSDPRVEYWLARQDRASVYITAITEAELRFGAAILPAGRRRDLLAGAIDGLLGEDFTGRIIPFDSAAAARFAVIAAERRAIGRPIPEADCQIAAIVSIHNATLATRNVSDFMGCGIRIFDPWATD